MTSPERLLRICDVCGALDDAPRHVTGVEDGGVPPKELLDKLPDNTPVYALVEVLDPSTVVRHFDCCASQGCANCTQLVAAAEGRKNTELVEFIVAGGVDHLNEGA